MENKDSIILAIDQGSGSTKALAINLRGQIIDQSEVKISTSFPKAGWVEQDPEEIWSAVVASAREITSKHKISAVGLSVQRESVLFWDSKTGAALTPVVTWQDRRASDLAQRHEGEASVVKKISGLNLDPMFSALKAEWLLQNSNIGDLPNLAMGTIDSWIAFKLGAGHVIEVGSASRTQLLDLQSGDWSPELLKIFNLSPAILPAVFPSDAVHLCTEMSQLGVPAEIPLSGIMGDSHAALFAHQGWRGNNFKATFGTGTSLMGLTREKPETIAWSLDGKITHAVEANILSTGSTLVWVAKLLSTTPEALASLAENSTEQIEIVPAFSGLGAPFWDRDAIGIISGLTLGTSAADLAAAALRATANQINDVIENFADSKVEIEILFADGGGARNAYLMQLIADITGKQIRSSKIQELSAFGAALAAALGAKLLTFEDLASITLDYDEYLPKLNDKDRQEQLNSWRRALNQSRIK